MGVDLGQCRYIVAQTLADSRCRRTTHKKDARVWMPDCMNTDREARLSGDTGKASRYRIIDVTSESITCRPRVHLACGWNSSTRALSNLIDSGWCSKVRERTVRMISGGAPCNSTGQQPSPPLVAEERFFCKSWQGSWRTAYFYEKVRKNLYVIDGFWVISRH